MTALLERPRMVVAVCAALLAIIVAAMLAGGALAGDGDCSGDAGDPPRTQR